MKKKIYILAVTFLCLLCSQMSYGFGGEGNYGDDDDYGSNFDWDTFVDELRDLVGEDTVHVYEDLDAYMAVINNDGDPTNDISLYFYYESEYEGIYIQDWLTDEWVPYDYTVGYELKYIDGYDKDGFDLFGYDREGFYITGYNDAGYDHNGYDLNGYDQNGYDQNGHDNLGYDWFGYDSNGLDQRGYEASDYDSNGYDSTGYDSTGFDSNGYSDPNLQENYKRRWFVDKDNDNHSSKVVYFDPFEVKDYPYKLTVFGPDCDDNNEYVQIKNSCGDCAVAPPNGKCPCKTSAADLKEMFGLTDAKATQLADVLNKHAYKFGIDTKEKLQHFLAQVKKETGNLTNFTENVEEFKLTSVSKVGHHFYKYFFPTTGQANHSSYLKDISDLTIAGSPYLDAEKLCNIVYDDRNLIRSRKNLNGNNQDGDGYKFRGGGALQLTGREKYTDFNTYYNSLPGVTPHDFIKNPELIQNNTDNLGIISGMWFFMTKVLKPIKNFQTRASSSDLNEQIKLNIEVSKAVQGSDGTAGDRLTNLKLAEQKIKCN